MTAVHAIPATGVQDGNLEISQTTFIAVRRAVGRTVVFEKQDADLCGLEWLRIGQNLDRRLAGPDRCPTHRVPVAVAGIVGQDRDEVVLGWIEHGFADRSLLGAQSANAALRDHRHVAGVEVERLRARQRIKAFVMPGAVFFHQPAVLGDGLVGRGGWIHNRHGQVADRAELQRDCRRSAL